MNVFGGVEIVHVLHALRHVATERIQSLRDSWLDVAKERHRYPLGVRRR